MWLHAGSWLGQGLQSCSERWHGSPSITTVGALLSSPAHTGFAPPLFNSAARTGTRLQRVDVQAAADSGVPGAHAGHAGGAPRGSEHAGLAEAGCPCVENTEEKSACSDFSDSRGTPWPHRAALPSFSAPRLQFRTHPGMCVCCFVVGL